MCGSKFVIGGTPARYFCGTHANGANHASTNYLRVARDVAEAKLLEPVMQQLHSPEAIAFAVNEIRRHWREKQNAANVAKYDRQIEEPERLVRDGTLSPAAAGAVPDRAKSDREAAMMSGTKADSRQLEQVVKMVSKAADTYRAQHGEIREVLSDERSAHGGRFAMRELFGGTGKLHPAGDHLMAEMQIGRGALLKAAGAEIWIGSGGSLRSFPTAHQAHNRPLTVARASASRGSLVVLFAADHRPRFAAALDCTSPRSPKFPCRQMI